MKQRSVPGPTHLHRHAPGRLLRVAGGCLGCLGLALMMSLAGCGRSESPTPPVVTPPGPNGDGGDTEPAESDPPGGLVLPPGDIPPLESELDTGSGDEEGIQMPKDANVPVESGAAAGPQIKYGTWEEILDAATSSGRITVIDLWSLACEPCLKEFPGLVRLHQTHGTKIQCIAVDLDFDGRKTRPPEHYEQEVAQFLNSVNASGFPTYISSTPNEDVYAATGLASIPAVLIYDAGGQLVKVFVDAGETAGFSYHDDVIPLVTKMAG